VARKNSTVRLTEAVNFITTTHVAGATPDVKAALVAAIRNWRTITATPVQTQLSNAMSQQGVVNRSGTQANRQYRRATIFLKCAISDPTPGHWAGVAAHENLNGGADYAERYRLAVRSAIDACHNTVLAATGLIQSLKTNPGRFLNSYKLMVDGPGASQREQYGVRMDDLVLKVRIQLTTAPVIQTSAVKVGVTSWLAVRIPGGGTNPLVGTDSAAYAGADLMLTTQFTGCTYCFQKNPAGTEVKAAHVDPGAALNGTRLPHLANVRGGIAAPGVIYSFAGDAISAELRASGAFANPYGGTFRAHGRNFAAAVPTDGYDGTANSVIILCIKIGGVWEIWRQKGTATAFSGVRIDQ
jgi:hypothetical protein